MKMPRPATGACGVFVILLGSYAYFWHTRDWNSASRLMLTYAIVDRGTISLDGLKNQTGDIAVDRKTGRSFTDKLPGGPLLGVVPYKAAKLIGNFPDHPLNTKGFQYWPADYWVTLATSGILTAFAGGLLVMLARELGCGPRRAVLVGLAYGLATPAYVYATMSYGHQPAAVFLLGAFVLLWRTDAARPRVRMLAAGFLAAYGAVIELQLGPVSAILGLYLIAQVIGRKRPASALGEFTVGALVPTVMLLIYNQLAWGSPFDMGYFHLIHPVFRGVHSAANPLGLKLPVGTLLARSRDLLWGGYRGLLFYAPIVILAVPGWLALAARRYWGMAIVSLAVVVAVFCVNLSYPAWDGGWTTGPRLLVPLLAFAMLPVAAALSAGGRWATCAAVALTMAGAVLMLLFQGVGGRVPPEPFRDPLVQYVLPRWLGGPLGRPPLDVRFARNLTSMALPAQTLARIPARWLWVQFVPLVLFQVIAVGLLIRRVKTPLAAQPDRAREAAIQPRLTPAPAAGASSSDRFPANLPPSSEPAREASAT
jgi:hypothetical protein